jgi:colicin import membrane protein
MERRRLVGELKAQGDKSGAAQLAKLGRPPISAWAVNQLWWHAREAFDELFETAAELRRGKLSASPAHRKAIAKLGVRAQQLLSEGGHSASDATLRRVAMTLSALAAVGSFEPDLPGALSQDRDPPGFEAFGIASSSEAQADDQRQPALDHQPAPRAVAHADEHSGKAKRSHEPAAVRREADAKRISEGAERQREAEAAAAERQREAEAAAAERQREAEAAAAERQREAEAAAERQREAEAKAKRQAQRDKLESDLRHATAELAEREHERDRIEKQLATAEREVERARARVDAARAKLDAERAS